MRHPEPRKRPRISNASTAISRRPSAARKETVTARKKYVYYFGEGHAEGNAKMKDILGGKGAGLAEMTNIGVPVPPGFTISTEVCTYFYEHEEKYPPELKKSVEENLARVEKSAGRKFGDSNRPLLVSVRSGARASMPGMMDTILNLGLNDQTVHGLAKSAKDERFAYDSYRRFIQMYSDVVLGIDKEHFEKELFAARDRAGVKSDAQIPAADLKALVDSYKNIVTKSSKSFPQEPQEQLWGAIGAVFQSWNNQRAITYRKLNGIPDAWGTAVNVQSMVVGNMGDDCATGVAFTRNPSTGEKKFFGEYLPNAQGEDVVAGIRTPLPISKAQAVAGEKSLEEATPEDIAGMHSAAGILTTRGGLTSHAAVVARGMGRPCVVGAGALKVDYGRGELRSEGHEPLEEGDWVSIDGTTGEIIGGKLPTKPPEVIQVLVEGTMKPEQSEVYRNFDRLLKWADEIRTLGVRTNADTPNDARVARLFGAAGIGLCRTEHMFFAEERIIRVREMILARNEEGRRRALEHILPFQKADFEGIFRELAGMPVTIRLLDPPLHEFLPHTESQISTVARDMEWGFVELRAKVNQLHETNPMLGHRGCRLAITFPEIYEMQVRAIYEAACAVKKDGVAVHPEVMIPLVGTIKELQLTTDSVRRVAAETLKEQETELPIIVGT